MGSERRRLELLALDVCRGLNPSSGIQSLYEVDAVESCVVATIVARPDSADDVNTNPFFCREESQRSTTSTLS